LDEKTKQEIVKNLTKNIQAGLVPSSAEQKAKEEQNKILNYMMQQKKQEEEKNERLNNIVKQNEQQQRIFQNIGQTKKINKAELITSSIDSEDSTIKTREDNS
jgi:hypothetical protein